MLKIAEVKMRYQGKTVLFNVNNVDFKPQDVVIIESDRGQDFGNVVTEAEPAAEDTPRNSLKKILRVATPEDLEKIENNKKETKTIFDTTQKKIQI